MSLLAAERIKLASTRSPWWCVVLALGLTTGFATLIAANISERTPASVGMSQAGWRFGLVVIMVMAALAVTTEYRTGTIKTTFQTVPNRTAALLAKTAIVSLVAGVVGEVAAFASWGMTKLVATNENLDLSTAAPWRAVAGVGLVYALGAVIALAVGMLLRHTAGAIALLLIYVLLAENLVSLIPKIGDDIQKWMPFTMVNGFLSADGSSGPTGGSTDFALGPWWSLLYFAGVAAVLLIAALFVTNRRDA
jgi:ABC-2 type transport system permease protein